MDGLKQSCPVSLAVSWCCCKTWVNIFNQLVSVFKKLMSCTIASAWLEIKKKKKASHIRYIWTNLVQNFLLKQEVASFPFAHCSEFPASTHLIQLISSITHLGAVNCVKGGFADTFRVGSQIGKISWQRGHINSVEHLSLKLFVLFFLGCISFCQNTLQINCCNLYDHSHHDYSWNQRCFTCSLSYYPIYVIHFAMIEYVASSNIAFFKHSHLQIKQIKFCLNFPEKMSFSPGTLCTFHSGDRHFFSFLA